MTDRELLELAAKAIGLAFWEENEWNPLTDDGDALRLAVKLRMDVETSLVHSGVIYADVWNEAIEDYRYVHEPEGADPCAATRRAITRAAAEIGKAMP